MSRRKVSVKELGALDCQGWLYRKKGSKGFLGIKWKKYWFVLKGTSLYWYTCQTAEKAEGYINLSDFTVDQAKECKKKHAMKASHPQVVTLYFAAESVKDLNKWLAKLTGATQTESSVRYSECYSEDSEQEVVETMVTSSPLYSEQMTTDVNEDGPPPCSTSSPCHSTDPVPVPASIMTESCEALATGQSENITSPEWPGGGQDPLHPADLPWLMVSGEEDGREVEAQGGEEDGTSDEMERLYIHLKNMRLSPTGELKPSTQKDFRTSFIRRCKNEKINEKLHLIRILNSTLKAKETDLLAIEQVLAEATLTAHNYRQWRIGNMLLLQEITQCKGPPGGSRELPLLAPRVPSVAEASL